MKKINNYRSDINKYTDDYRLANIIRALNYENIPYKIINNEIYSNKDPENPKHIKITEDDYNKLDQYYRNKLPLWENDLKNAKKYEDLYNDKKWIIGKRELKRMHNKLLIFDNGYKMKIGFLWKKQPFKQRPTYTNYKKFVKNFKIQLNDKIITENENWGAVLALAQQYIKDNAYDFYSNYDKLDIYGYCKSENTWFKIVRFDILETEWLVDENCQFL